ncbi:MAG: hypothetical protein V3R16_08575 [Nitrospirales bacterium]
MGDPMATSKNPYHTTLRELASLILSVAGESVSMMKRSAPERSLSLKPKEEWGIYLEFLKILFNLADRMSALHIPLKDQPQFMDGLEDVVGEQLKTAMAPALKGDSDPMEIVITVGEAVADSRKLYEPYKFAVTDESKEKGACFALLATRVADAMGTTGDGMVTSAAVLCTSAVIPAMKSLFEGHTSGAQPVQAGTEDTAPSSGTSHDFIGNEIKLVSVMSSVHDDEVETRWGMHPQFRQDLSAEEAKELSRLMNRVAQILGERYAAVAFSESWASWHHPGHA